MFLGWGFFGGLPPRPPSFFFAGGCALFLILLPSRHYPLGRGCAPRTGGPFLIDQKGAKESLRGRATAGLRLRSAALLLPSRHYPLGRGCAPRTGGPFLIDQKGAKESLRGRATAGLRLRSAAPGRRNALTPKNPVYTGDGAALRWAGVLLIEPCLITGRGGMRAPPPQQQKPQPNRPPPKK